MNMHHRSNQKVPAEEAKGLFDESDGEDDTLFQPVKLNRNKEQTVQVPRALNAMGPGKAEIKANPGDLQMFYQISDQQPNKEQHEPRGFDDILEYDEVDKFQNKHSDITAGQMLDDDIEFVQDNTKNFSFNTKKQSHRNELLVAESQELTIHKKQSFGPAVKSQKQSHDDFDVDSSLNNRVSDSLDSSLINPKMSLAGTLFNNTSINEERKSNGNADVKKSPHFKSKNSSGKSKQINQSNPSTGGSKDQSWKIKSLVNSGGSKEQSQKIKSIQEQDFYSPVQKIQTSKIQPKDIYHDFLNQPKESPELIRETDSDREQDEVAKVIHRKVPAHGKNYHSHRPSLAIAEDQLLFPDEKKQAKLQEAMRVSSVISNIETEGHVSSPDGPKGVRKHIKNLSMDQNSTVFKKIRITPTAQRKIADAKEGVNNKLIIRKSSIKMKRDLKTPEKKTNTLTLQVPAGGFETSEKQKNRMMLKSWADNNQFAYMTEKKPQTSTPIKSRLVQGPPLFVSQQNFVENDNTSPTDNETPLFKQNINNSSRFGSKIEPQTRNQTTSVFDQVPNKQKYETLQNTTSAGPSELEGVIQINSLRELLGIFGVSLQENNTFEYQGTDYKVNINEASHKPLILRRHGLNRLNRSSISSQQHSSLMMVKDSEPLNQSEILPSLINDDQENRFQNLRSNTPNNLSAIGRHGPDLNLGERLERLHSKSPFLEPIHRKDGNHHQITRSQHNLLLPPSGKTNTFKEINNPSEKFAQAQLMTNLKSQRSGLSSYSRRSDKSKHSQKSQIVSSHELQAERQRRKNRKNSQNKSIGFRKDYSPLQIERQNQTDYNQVINNQLNVKQEIKPNLSQQQLMTNKFLHSKKSDNTNSGNASSQLQIENYNTTSAMPLLPRMSGSQENYVRIDSVENPMTDDLCDTTQQQTVGQTVFEPIHLAFLFASPLMLKTSDSNVFNSPLPPISFSEEFEQIRTCFEEKSMAINYIYHVATQKNLLAALRKLPIGLHFSGHGFQNTEKLYNNDSKAWAKYKNKGDVLIFENESGASEFFFTSDLKEMFQEIKHSMGTSDSESANVATNLQFVYVASCHSEQVGKVFQEAGVPHVICINQKETILDKAAVEFSKFFYDEVFDRYNSICDAFNFAKKRVEEKYGKHHAKKLLLLLNSETHGEKCQNDKQRTHLKGQGQPQQIGQFTELVFLPSKVSSLLFRNQDMYDVLQLLSDERTNIVQIWGMPGLGKSSLLKNCTCYLSERDIYKDGMIYIDFMHVSSFTEILQILNAYLKDVPLTSCSDGICDCAESQDEPLDSDDSDDEDQQERLLKLKIATFQKKILFAMDNIEHLIGTHHTRLLQFIGDIAEKNVKVLFSSSKYDAKNLPDGVFQVKKILKMSKKESVQLFIKKIPLVERDKQNFLDYSNIEELHQVTLEVYGSEKCSKLKLCDKKRHEHSDKCIIDYLQEHVLFDFFAGIPLVISIVASMSVEQSLAEIFKYMAEQHGKHLKEDLKDKIDDKGLIMCLEYCTNYFTGKKDTSALNLWYLIGTQGPGILYDDLCEIMASANIDTDEPTDLEESKTLLAPNSRLDKNLEDLIQFSLIEEERLDKAGKMRRFRVSPFVDQYVNNKLDPRLKNQKLTSVCMHINEKLKQFKEDYSEAMQACKSKADFEAAQNEILEQIRPYEQQILHVVNTLFKLVEEGKLVADQSETTYSLKEIDEETESDVNTTVHEPSSTDQQRISQVSFSVLSQQQRRKSKRSGVQQDEMFPVVSQFIKEARSSIVIKQDEVKGVLQDFGAQKIHRMTTVKNEVLASKSFKQPAAENTMFESLQRIEKTKSKQSETPQVSLGKHESKGSFYNNPREHQQNLAFIDAKDSYLQDFMQERNSILMSSVVNPDDPTTNKKDGETNEQCSNDSDILGERDQSFDVTSNAPVGKTRQELEIFNQKSSDGGPFQNISENTNQDNPNSEKDTQVSSFDYHLNRKNTIIPPRRDELTAKDRQSMHLKKLDQIDPRDQGKMVEVYQNFRNSIYINSVSKDKNGILKQLQSFQYNPDLIRNPTLPSGIDFDDEISKISPKRPTDVIDAFIRSAPPKLEQTSKLSEAKAKTHHEMLQHEELLYNYLSILALVPAKHAEFMSILNNYGQRREQNQSNAKDGSQQQQQVFNPVTQAEKKLKQDMTIVKIPDEAVLLLVNTKLLELYVCIQQNDDTSEKNIANKKKKIDHITEFAEEIGQFFLKIGFKRGLAIISYIQAQRQYKQFRKLSVFKRLIKQSSLLFFQTYELDGLEQCLTYSEKVLRFDSSKQIKSDIASVKNNEMFIEDISRIKTTLECQSDQNVKNFVQFRSDMKVKRLDSKVVVEPTAKSASGSVANSSTNAAEQKTTLKSDQIMNMMLSAQHQLQKLY